MINDFFDHIFCVNLDRRPDKWELAQKEFAKWGIDVERFPAIDGNLYHKPEHRVPPGSIGNCMSKIGILRLAIERNYDNVLILEDDVEFADDFNTKFGEWSKEVPGNWDMLWIGGNHNGKTPPKFSEHLYRITNTYATHAFALRNTVFKAVLSDLEPLEPQDDIILTRMQKMSLALCFAPNLAYQRAGVSDVFNIYQDYDFLRKI